jgi:predicted Zn-dependent protease
MRKLYNRLAREDGQTMAEYGVVLTVITLASCTSAPLSLDEHHEESADDRGLHLLTAAGHTRFAVRGSRLEGIDAGARSADG